MMNTPLVAGSNITITWRETAITQHVNRPCPCQNLTQKFESVITRHCGGSYSQGARWEDMDYSQCGLTIRSIRLCEALQVRKTLLCSSWNIHAIFQVEATKGTGKGSGECDLISCHPGC